ncbi:DUF2905 domain-containing protein [Natronospira bacteriovora]|uniref:DUF2905 domain-containing protein n=1 Tax=Natronospira bacteriovora TaxID=3069753 RepID=A0ABU0W432_9GAMM|nr:DUF2905 domain-containing protein [Natronospira sp. AB-CW4]MDQ2068518.1 DUF2905 domain-containing protein [Natronospira sp. AB-CW4]
MSDIQKLLIAVGAILIAIGFLWPLIDRFGLGRLPGDIVIERENLHLYFPLTTMILISIVISVLIWLFRR